MRTLQLKLIRELGHSKTQSLAIALVIASGVAVFVMSLNTLWFLRETRDAYYDRYRFAHLFASVRRAPRVISERLTNISGVAAVDTRIVSDVTLDVPDLLEPAVGRLISLPQAERSGLNRIHLRRGRMPDSDRAGEVLVSDAFFEANSLKLGDRIDAVLNGRLQVLTLVGVALSPEYVIQLRGGDLLPDEKRFGVFWMPHRQMESAFDMEGAFNDVSLRLLRGANEDDVIEKVDDILKPYGSIGAIGRDQQLSARFLSDEIKQLRATGLVAPAIFLGVAAFLLNIVLSRRISTHRSIIATLKAFGYTNREIGWHYMQSSLLVAGGGALAGVIGGHWMGSGLARLYSEFYRFPSFVYRSDSRVIVAAVGISLVAAIIGSARAVRSAVRLLPAEAMQPPTPPIFRRSWAERLGLIQTLPVPTRMILRGLQRRPAGAFLSSVGIAFSVSVMVMTGFFSDALDYLIDFQFAVAQRHDVQVIFREVTSSRAKHDLQNLPGVFEVEPFRAVAVDLKNGHLSYRTSILGLDSQRRLFRLLNTDAAPIRMPASGIVLNDKLADILQLAPGDKVTVDVLEGEEITRQIQVAGIAREYSGTNGYMDRDELNRFLKEDSVLSGAFVSVDDLQRPELYLELKRTPQVASVSIKSAMIDQFRDTIAANQLTMQSFTVFFATVIAVGVVYNTARISLDERSRELATLRVIGLTRGEVSAILLGELAVVTIVAIPLGWLIGFGFCAAMVSGFESELYRIPLVIHPASYARAAIVTVAAALVSGLVVRRRLDHLDLVEVLKSRE